MEIKKGVKMNDNLIIIPEYFFFNALLREISIENNNSSSNVKIIFHFLRIFKICFCGC